MTGPIQQHQLERGAGILGDRKGYSYLGGVYQRGQGRGASQRLSSWGSAQSSDLATRLMARVRRAAAVQQH